MFKPIRSQSANTAIVLALTLAMSLIPVQPALADGGRGGGSGGGAGGGVDSGHVGQPGGDGSLPSGGGGGGGPGANGGDGRVTGFGYVGVGGQGGQSAGEDGQDGGPGGGDPGPVNSGGGGGGGGGAHGQIDIPGGKGGDGGDSIYGHGHGGGGGAGGYGQIVDNDDFGATGFNFAGGHGGDGGQGSGGGEGGGGGDGGVGFLSLRGNVRVGIDIAGVGSVIGGDGGATGANYLHGRFGNGGDGVVLLSESTLNSAVSIRGGDGGDAFGTDVHGGNGGHGVVFRNGGTVINTGTISGGDAGLGSGLGTDGAGGVGIIGGNLSIANTGMISGGLNADGSRADAIRFTGGDNRLALTQTSIIDGNVDATAARDAGGRNTFAVTATAAFHLDLASIGDEAKFRGFTDFEVASGGVFLRGESSQTTDWTVAADALLIIGNGNPDGAGDAVLRGNVHLADEGGLFFNNVNDSAYSGDVSGEGTATVDGARLTITGNWLLSGTSVVVGSELEVGNGGTEGSILGEISNHGQLSFNRSDAVTHSSLISGAGDVSQIGSGTLIIDGVNTYTGTTTVERGTLIVDGSIGHSSMTTVMAGARLGGTGTLGATTIASGGVHMLGNSGGRQTVAGNYINGGTFEVVGSPDGAGRLHVEGNANIAGAALTLVLSPITAADWNPVNGPFTILSSDNLITGTFTSVSNSLLFLNARVDYHLYNVDLTLTRNDIDFADVAETRNQRAAAGAVDSLGAGNAVWNAVAMLTDEDDARAAFDSVSGEVHGSLSNATFSTSRLVREAILERLRRFEPGELPVLAYAPQQTLAAPSPYRDEASLWQTHGWAEGFGSWGETDGDGNAGGQERETSGFIAGLDGTRDGLKAGLALGYTTSDADTRARASSAAVESAFAALYGGTDVGAIRLRGGVSYAHNWIDTDRSVALLGETLKADYDGSTFQAFAEAGYRIDTTRAMLEPFVGLATVRLHTDAFEETGGTAALEGASETDLLGATTLGINFETAVLIPGLTLNGTLAWQHAFGDVDPERLLAFRSGGSEFRVAGVPIDEDALIVEAGASYDASDLVTLGLSYQGAIGADARDHGVAGRLEIRF